MLTIKPGQHGSTFGGNPVASRIGVEALKVFFFKILKLLYSTKFFKNDFELKI